MNRRSFFKFLSMGAALIGLPTSLLAHKFIPESTPRSTYEPIRKLTKLDKLMNKPTHKITNTYINKYEDICYWLRLLQYICQDIKRFQSTTYCELAEPTTQIKYCEINLDRIATYTTLAYIKYPGTELTRFKKVASSQILLK